MILENKLGRVKRLKGWHLIVIMAMTMSGCMATNVLGNGPVLTMDSGILVNQRKFRVPFLDGADIMVFSPDNRYLVTTGSYSQHINVYDVESRKIVKRFPREDKSKIWEVSRLFVAFTPDSRYLVLRNTHANNYFVGKYHLVDTSTFEVVKSVITDKVGGDMHFSQDGKYVVLESGAVSLTNNSKRYGKRPIMSLYDARTWELINDSVKKGFGPNAGIAYTSDSRYLIDVAKLGDDYELTKGNPPVIRIWSLPDLKVVRTIDGFFAPDARLDLMQLSHDGKVLAMVAYDEETIEELGGTLLVDIETGKLINDYGGPTGYPGFSQHSKYFFLSSGQETARVIYILDIETFEILEKVTQKQGTAEIETVFSPDGSKMALSNGRTFYIWDVKE